MQNGVPVANAVANIAFNNANKVVSFGSSFVKPSMSRSSHMILQHPLTGSLSEDPIHGAVRHY